MRYHSECAGSGFLPSRLGQATIGSIFLVGDAAGQCEGLTGFGVRPALYFGTKCGDVIQQVIENEMSLGEGLRRYQAVLERFRRYYSFLRWAQDHLITLSDSQLTWWLTLFSWPPTTRFLLRGHRRHTLLEEVTTKGLAFASLLARAQSGTRG